MASRCRILGAWSRESTTIGQQECRITNQEQSQSQAKVSIKQAEKVQRQQAEDKVGGSQAGVSDRGSEKKQN